MIKAAAVELVQKSLENVGQKLFQDLKEGQWADCFELKEGEELSQSKARAVAEQIMQVDTCKRDVMADLRSLGRLAIPGNDPYMMVLSTPRAGKLGINPITHPLQCHYLMRERK